MYLPDCSKRQRVEPPHVKEGIGMSEGIDAVLKSANWSKESIIEVPHTSVSRPRWR